MNRSRIAPAVSLLCRVVRHILGPILRMHCFPPLNEHRISCHESERLYVFIRPLAFPQVIITHQSPKVIGYNIPIIGGVGVDVNPLLIARI